MLRDKAMSIFHVSDTHFEEHRLAEKIRCFEYLLDRAEEAKPEIAVHTGDVFDHGLRLEDPAAQAAVKLLGRLADICPLLIIRGNFSHDRNSVEILKYVRGKYPIHVSIDPEVITLNHGTFSILLNVAAIPDRFEPDWKIVSGPSAVFFTLPYPSSSFLAKLQTMNPEELRRSVSENITAIIRGFGAIETPHGVPRVLLYHGVVSGAKMTESQHSIGMDIELRPSDIAYCKFDLVCAGHLHYKQIIEAGDTKCFYTGGHVYSNYGDEGEKGAWLYEVSPFDRRLDIKPETINWEPKKLVNVVGPLVGLDLKFNFIKTPAIPMRTFDIDLRSSPFIAPPDWANEECDLKVRVTVKETDSYLIRDLDLKSLFPNARSIVTQRITEPVLAVRCEEVRTARRLRDKIKVYCDYAGISTPDSLLEKSDMLEAADPEKLQEIVKAGLR